MTTYTYRSRGAVEVDMVLDPTDVDALFLELNRNLSDPGLMDFMETIVAPWVHERIEERFDKEGDDVTGKWKGLAPATQAIRAGLGFSPSHPINVRTGDFRDWLANDPGVIAPIGGEVAFLFPNDPTDYEMRQKLETAQQGKKTPATPPRPILGLNRYDLAFVQSNLVQWILGAYA